MKINGKDAGFNELITRDAHYVGMDIRDFLSEITLDEVTFEYRGIAIGKDGSLFLNYECDSPMEYSDVDPLGSLADKTTLWIRL